MNCTAIKTIYYTGTQTEWQDKYNLYYSCLGVDNSAVIYKANTEYDFDAGLRYTSLGNGTCYASLIPTVSLKEYTIPEKSPAGNTVAYLISDYMLKGNTTVTKVDIQAKIDSIGTYAFYQCSNLTSISIPNSVTRIESYAFEGVYLEVIYYGGTQEDWNISQGDHNSAFLYSINYYYYSETQPTDITHPYWWHYVDGVVTVWDVLNYVSNGDGTCYVDASVAGGNLVIPSVSPTGDRVTSIGEKAFESCTTLTNVTIPDSVTSIGSCAFYDCISLTSITIPDSVTNISSSAFSGCSSLTSITIPDRVTRIEGSVFDGCSTLTSITIPGSVTSIGGWAFDDCSNLTSVYYGGTATDWDEIGILSYSNDYLISATRYYYSDTQPTAEGNYWHYVDGVPTAW